MKSISSSSKRCWKWWTISRRNRLYIYL